MTHEVLVRMSGIEKSYPGVRALNGVDFELRAGEVHCLVGENGAGKSTLMRTLTGAEQPDGGVITIDGRELKGLRPSVAYGFGISAIYQETDLVPELTVVQNMFLGHEPRNALGMLDRAAMRKRARQTLDELNVAIPVDARVSDLSAASAQLVQIAKALTRDTRVLIMDEPGAVLSDHELETLFVIVNDLRARGLGIIYISHRLEELLHLGDRVTVMRDGQWVSTKKVSDTSISEIIHSMVGRVVDDQYAKTPVAPGEVMLQVDELSSKGHFSDVSFEVRRGEIVGIAGLVGSGRSSLLNCIFGAIPHASGRIVLEGVELTAHTPRKAISRGIGLVPEDRRGTGLVLARSVQENMTLPSLDALSWGGFLRSHVLREVTTKLIGELRVKTPSTGQQIRLLSGGNQQKVVLAKWLARGVKVLLLDEPTAGVDIGAKSEIYAIMNDLVAQGLSIVMVSSELSEVLGMSDRVIVMSEGRVTTELPIQQATREVIMSAAVPQGRRAA